jgi:hypothetical protein
VYRQGPERSFPGGPGRFHTDQKKPGKCAPDSESDKKCDNKDTYLHKAVGKYGKLKKSCRLSKEKEMKKNPKTNENLAKSKANMEDEKKGKTDEKNKNTQDRKE